VKEPPDTWNSGDHDLTKREKMAGLVTDRKLLVFTGLVAGFTILGPFGTYEILGLWERLIFWALMVTGIGALMHVCIVLSIESDRLSALPRWSRIALGAAIAAVPAVALIIFFTGYFFPAPVQPEVFPMLWGQVAAIGAVAGIVEYRPLAPPPPQPERPVETRLHRRLPEGERHDIVSLTVRDHYVEVTTTGGQHMLLMRLTDAIEELDDLPGERIHRSHWAAARHLRRIARRGQKQVVLLSDGRELPVSKSYADAVEARLAAVA
jgi:DNA-binding LytR/AlgR family response regulator